MERLKERTNGRRKIKMNRFYRACVFVRCEQWVNVLRHQMHFHDFRPNCDELLEFRRKWCDSKEHKILGNAIRRCSLCYTIICYILIVPSTDQFSHTPGLYGNTKQMQCVAEFFWYLFSSEMCELVHASTGDRCVCSNTYAIYSVGIFQVLVWITEDFNHFLNRTSKKQHLNMFGFE